MIRTIKPKSLYHPYESSAVSRGIYLFPRELAFHIFTHGHRDPQ